MKKGSSVMVKVDTRVSPETYERMVERAERVYGGNMSLCMRLAIEKGIDILNNIDAVGIIKELIEDNKNEVQKRHNEKNT
jgi:hypothetical protein